MANPQIQQNRLDATAPGEYVGGGRDTTWGEKYQASNIRAGVKGAKSGSDQDIVNQVYKKGQGPSNVKGLQTAKGILNNSLKVQAIKKRAATYGSNYSDTAKPTRTS